MSGAITRKNWDKHGERPSVLDFGAVADGVDITDGAINNGSTALHSASGPFLPSHFGKAISLQRVGGGQLDTTIAAYVSMNQVTLAASWPDANATGVEAWWGTDNGAAIQAGLNAVRAHGGGTLYVPPGMYMTGRQLVVTNRVNLQGLGSAPCTIKSLQNKSTGYGYSTGTGIAVTAICIGGGSGCKLNITAVSAAGGITTATINAAGTGYTLFDTLQPAGGTGGSILITAVNGSGGVTSIQIMHGPLVVDPTTFVNVTYSWLQSIAIDASNIPGSTGIKVNSWNEHSGTKSVLVKGYCYAGYVIIGFSCQNWSIENAYCFASYDPSASGVVGILLNKSASINRITRATVVGSGGAGPAVYVTFCQVNIFELHFESHAVGVQFDQEGQGVVDGLYGHATATDNIQILGSNNGGISCRNLQNGNTPNQIVDGLTGTTITAVAEPILTQYDISQNGTNLLTTARSVASILQLLNVATTLRAQGDFYVGAGSTLLFHLLRSDIDVIQHDTEGVLLQTSSMTAARSGGGLQVGGGGSGNDPTVGIMCAGCTGDGSTFTARAAEAAIVTFATGAINIYADTGLSAGSAYTPTLRLQISTSGVKVAGAFGCNGTAPQAAFASGGSIAAVLPGTGTSPWGFSSSGDFAATIALIDNIRTALVNNGIMF